MLIRTHLAITVFGILLLIQSVENKLVFVLVALVATFIPDVDSRYSTLGRRKVNRLLQFFTRHRGITHSFVFLILLTFVLLLFLPVAALGIFLGYGLHLIADSFTHEGIKPFYPFTKLKSRGRVASGGKIEIFIFMSLIIVDVALFFLKVF